MTELVKDSATSAAVLLTHYSFDLGGYTADQLIRQWLGEYQASWIRSAVIEALYQGRYKAVSVEQILALWNRRGQPLYHFNHEFERIVCHNFPQSWTPRADDTSETASALKSIFARRHPARPIETLKQTPTVPPRPRQEYSSAPSKPTENLPNSPEPPLPQLLPPKETPPVTGSQPSKPVGDAQALEPTSAPAAPLEQPPEETTPSSSPANPFNLKLSEAKPVASEAVAPEVADLEAADIAVRDVAADTLTQAAETPLAVPPESFIQLPLPAPSSSTSPPDTDATLEPVEVVPKIVYSEHFQVVHSDSSLESAEEDLEVRANCPPGKPPIQQFTPEPSEFYSKLKAVAQGNEETAPVLVATPKLLPPSSGSSP